MVLAMNVLRALTAIAGVSGAILLFVRSRRWKGRFREPAFLHLSAGILAIAASMNALDHWGDGITRFTAFNVGGIALAWTFLFRTPMEKTFSWREQRGDPPDWDSLRRNTGG